MTTEARQARWRARDEKRLVQVRLTAEAVVQLDKLVERAGASGRAEAIERLLMADAGPQPDWTSHFGIRLVRAWFRATGRRSLVRHDETHTYAVEMIPRH